MILVCTQKCFILDRSIKPGQPLDIPESMINADIVKASFSKPETVQAQKKAESDAADLQGKTELTATEIKRRLDEMGISYKGNASRDALQNILNAQLAARNQQAE